MRAVDTLVPTASATGQSGCSGTASAHDYAVVSEWLLLSLSKDELRLIDDSLSQLSEKENIERCDVGDGQVCGI